MGNIKYSWYLSHFYILLIVFDLLVLTGREIISTAKSAGVSSSQPSPCLRLGCFRTTKLPFTPASFPVFPFILVPSLTSHSTDDPGSCLPPCLCYSWLSSRCPFSLSRTEVHVPHMALLTHSLQVYLVSSCPWILHLSFVHTGCPIPGRMEDSHWESNRTLYG